MQNMSEYIWPTYSIRWSYVESTSKFKEVIEKNIIKKGDKRLDKRINERRIYRWIIDRRVNDRWIIIIEDEI
jgi:hypothetical protein